MLSKKFFDIQHHSPQTLFLVSLCLLESVGLLYVSDKYVDALYTSPVVHTQQVQGVQTAEIEKMKMKKMSEEMQKEKLKNHCSTFCIRFPNRCPLPTPVASEKDAAIINTCTSYCQQNPDNCKQWPSKQGSSMSENKGKEMKLDKPHLTPFPTKPR